MLLILLFMCGFYFPLSGWSSAPEVVSWGPNHIDLFALGPENACYHTSWNGISWSSWENLEGQFTSSIKAVSWAPGRIDLFGRGENMAVLHNAWDGTRWYQWGDLGGDPNLGGWVNSGIEAVSRGVNQIDIFALGADNTCLYKTWNGTSWTPWSSLGGMLTGPVCAGAANDLIHNWWNGTRWHGWESMGGTVISDIACISLAPNRLDVFGLGGGNSTWQRRLGDNKVFSAVTASASGENQIDLFAVGIDNGLYHQVWNGNGWGGWAWLGGSLISNIRTT
ncbi:hypothetical protein F5B17DRAFT_443543 [Nemania serpens]|nr:hypothetical protein F5B17DRAFT_443543 [Nemania serpens]